jgi:hypothetical protein
MVDPLLSVRRPILSLPAELGQLREAVTAAKRMPFLL